MTTTHAALMLMNATFFGACITCAVCRWSEGVSAKGPLTLAAINFAAIAIALI